MLAAVVSRRSSVDMGETSSENIADREKADQVRSTAPEHAEYCGIPIEDWKLGLRKDLEERFGPTPDDLKPTGEPGW